MRVILLALSLLIFYFNAEAQELNFAWSSYDTSSKVEFKSFSSLTKLESEFAQVLPDFRNNRARLTLTDGKNRISPRELRQPDFPMPCKCLMVKDTIFITSAVGMMAGLGLVTAITKDRFATTFFHDADNTNIFKLKESDNTYIDRISVSTAEQKLILLKKPSFKNNEVIAGQFEGKFKTYYELDLGELLTRNYRAKLLFKCRLSARENK